MLTYVITLTITAIAAWNIFDWIACLIIDKYIKKCPSCHKKAHIYSSAKKHAVICDNCGACGKASDDMLRAVNEWDKLCDRVSDTD